MAIKVVDASALAALLFGEPEGEFVANALDGAHLVAPGLLEFELANVCLIKSRRYPELRKALAAAFRIRERLEIEELVVNHADAIELGFKFGLTAYDASYLWLARKLGAEIVTLDVALGQAAATEGI